MIRRQTKSCKSTTQHNATFFNGERAVSIPAANLVCRKERILLTLDCTCPEAPRSVEFLAIRPSLAISIVSCRHPIQLRSGFGEVAICRNNIRCTKSLVLLLKMMLKYAQQKRSNLRCHRSVPNNSPPPKQRALSSQKWAGA